MNGNFVISLKKTTPNKRAVPLPIFHVPGVGLEFNHLFGFGVLDAGAMVALAKEWKTVPAR